MAPTYTEEGNTQPSGREKDRLILDKVGKVSIRVYPRISEQTDLHKVAHIQH